MSGLEKHGFTSLLLKKFIGTSSMAAVKKDQGKNTVLSSRLVNFLTDHVGGKCGKHYPILFNPVLSFWEEKDMLIFKE